MATTNFYIVKVNDSRTLTSINGTEIVFDQNPPPETTAGKRHAKFLVKDVGLKWIRLEIRESVDGVLYADSYKVIPGPPDKPLKIAVLERLIDSIRAGNISVFAADDFNEDESRVVSQLCSDGFLRPVVCHQGPAIPQESGPPLQQGVWELTPQELEELKGAGKIVNPKTGKSLNLNSTNFSSVFYPTVYLIRMVQCDVEPEPVGMDELATRVEAARDLGLGAAVLWLRMVGRAGAPELRLPARAFADALDAGAHKSGDLLVDWRKPKDAVIGAAAPVNSVVKATRDYPRSDFETDEPELASPFGKADPFWD